MSNGNDPRAEAWRVVVFNDVSAQLVPLVQGVTLVVGIWVMLVNLLIDLSYGLFDPRVKVGGRAG